VLVVPYREDIIRNEIRHVVTVVHK
jgi:hypothetical protein